MKKIFTAATTIIFSLNLFAQNYGTQVGQVAPEITMSAPDGTILSLSELRGKVVLIDFWASWCTPCRYENPTVVAAYTQFKNKKFKAGKGFEVYSVSLDKNKQAWVKGIQDDGLAWKYHVSDLQGWNSAAGRLYGVNSIPANFLIDKDGTILARNLRGQQLIAVLNSLLE
ncbi:MAG TPA: TlpA disulfide reductase family protein [Salinivirgaceae bacterium]|nr:TlpA disulfide reductase family protein [Salinivirgaceae bacterium]